MNSRRLRIAWFSAVEREGEETLSAYCSRVLLPELTKRHSIEVFSDRVSDTEWGIPSHYYINAYKRHQENPFDIFFYQLEDSKACRFIRGHIGLIPGVVWVHDLFCYDLGPEACHTSPWERTIEQFYRLEVPFADRAIAPHQLWPRAFRETSLSPVVLFSSNWARAEFSRMIHSRIESRDGAHLSDVLPVPIKPSSHAVRPNNSAVFRIATDSQIGIEGRAHKFLPAIRGLTYEWHLSWMVSPNDEASALNLLREFGLPEERVSLVIGRDSERWAEIARDSDVALHLHTSVFGHLAPNIQLSMSAACPVIVAQSGQGEDFPDSAVYRVVAGLHESTQIKSTLEAIYQIGSERCGFAGAKYVRESLSVEAVASMFSRGLETWAAEINAVNSRWEEISVRAKSKLIDEVKGLVSTWESEQISAFDLVIGPALKELGWDKF